MIKRLLLIGLFLLASKSQAAYLYWESTASEPCLEYFEIQSRDVDSTLWVTEDQPTVATACSTPDGHSIPAGVTVAAVRCEWGIPNKNKFFRVRRFFITRSPQGQIIYNPLPWVEAPQLIWVCDGGPFEGSGKVFPVTGTCK